MLLVEEREESRLLVLNGVDLDAVERGKALAAQVFHGAPVPFVGGIRVARVKLVAAMVGVPLEHDLRAPHPFPEDEGSRADGMRVRIVGIRLDHLARHRHDVRHREHVEEVVVRVLQLEADGVLVAHLDAGDLRVVVELARFLGLLRELVEADDLVLEEPLVRAAVLRVAETLDRVFHVAGDELALAPVEHRIVRIQDARLDAKRVARALLLAPSSARAPHPPRKRARQRRRGRGSGEESRRRKGAKPMNYRVYRRSRARRSRSMST